VEDKSIYVRQVLSEPLTRFRNGAVINDELKNGKALFFSAKSYK